MSKSINKAREAQEKQGRDERGNYQFLLTASSISFLQTSTFLPSPFLLPLNAQNWKGVKMCFQCEMRSIPAHFHISCFSFIFLINDQDIGLSPDK